MFCVKKDPGSLDCALDDTKMRRPKIGGRKMSGANRTTTGFPLLDGHVNVDASAALERRHHVARRRMLANYLYAGGLADERHQVIAGQEALRVMHQAYLEAVQRMTHGQQLEAAKVRRQDQRTFAGVLRMEF